jgi:hypothetical protein
MYYSHNNEYPVMWEQVPNRIRLSTGLTRTDKTTFTKEELEDAGWKEVSDPLNYNSSTHKLIWTGTDWQIVPLNEQELQQLKNNKWQEIRNIRDQKIKEVEWRVFRNLSEQRMGSITTENIETLDNYIQALRDVTKQEDPFNITWPTPLPPITNGNHAPPPIVG